MKITSKRYESICRILMVMTNRLQSLTEYSIELRAAGFEGAFHPFLLEWFDDSLKIVNKLYVQLKSSLSDDNLLNDLKKELEK